MVAWKNNNSLSEHIDDLIIRVSELEKRLKELELLVRHNTEILFKRTEELKDGLNGRSLQ